MPKTSALQGDQLPIDELLPEVPTIQHIGLTSFQRLPSHFNLGDQFCRLFENLIFQTGLHIG